MVRATFLGYRRSKRAGRKGEALIRVEGVRSAEKAAQLIGRRVFWQKERTRRYKGKRF